MLGEAELTALALSLKVALTATILGLLPAFALALLMARKTFPLKSLLDMLLHLPLVVPPVVVGYLLLISLAPISPAGRLLGDLGLPLAFSWQGAALASFIMALPLMVRAMRQSLEAVDPALLDVAATLGASPTARLWRITIPLALPGLISASILGFARAIGEFGATITFAANIPSETQTLPLALYSAAQTPGGEGPALMLAFLCCVPAMLSLMLSNSLTHWLLQRRGLKP